MKGSENPSGADDQQETELATLDPWWIAGFVDGEGCFSVSIHRNELAKPTGGWHVQPTFQVSQHGDSREILERLRYYFSVGNVRSKGAQSNVEVYTVHSTKQLEAVIIPFFECYPLQVKRDDFEAFAHIVRVVRRREHHTPSVFREIVERAYLMNRRGTQRKRSIQEILAGSSETTRQAPS